MVLLLLDAAVPVRTQQVVLAAIVPADLVCTGRGLVFARAVYE